jgi:hypothetical protein
MTLWVYGFVSTPDEDLLLPAGVDDEPVHLVVHGAVAAAVSQVSGSGDAVTRMLPHERVVEALLAAGAVIPARFGSVLADESDVLADLSRLSDVLVQALRRVQDHVELAVRLTSTHDPERPDPGPVTTGRAWIASRLAARDQGNRLQEEVHAVLAVASTQSRWWPSQPGGAGARASYLVACGQVDRFRDLAQGLAEELAGREIVLTCTGPWPPYSFSELGAA